MKATSLTPETLQDLIAQGEGQRLEFKRSLAELEAGARSVTSMANSDGGHVLFGVRDDGTILGVEIGAQTRERVVQAITDTSTGSVQATRTPPFTRRWPMRSWRARLSSW